MKIQGTQTLDETIVGHLGGELNRELNKMLLRKYHEEFTGTRADTKYSNVPLANFAYVMLKKEGINVHTPAELVRDWKLIPDGNLHYFDSCGVAVYPNKDKNEDHRQKILNLIEMTYTQK